MNWENVCCAGGSVLASLVKERVEWEHTDIDLFLCVDSAEEANAKLLELYQVCSIKCV